MTDRAFIFTRETSEEEAAVARGFVDEVRQFLIQGGWLSDPVAG